MSADLRGELTLREAGLTTSLADAGAEDGGLARHFVGNYATLFLFSQGPKSMSYRVGSPDFLAFLPTVREDGATVADFIEQLYRLGGFSSWGEFGREAGFPAATMSDWKRGENVPSGRSLLRLIQAATDRAPLAMREAAEATSPLAQIRSLLLSLEDEAERARAALVESLASIDARLSRIEAQLGVPAVRGSEGRQ